VYWNGKTNQGLRKIKMNCRNGKMEQTEINDAMVVYHEMQYG
jgi:hypothetical protein